MMEVITNPCKLLQLICSKGTPGDKRSVRCRVFETPWRSCAMEPEFVRNRTDAASFGPLRQVAYAYVIVTPATDIL